MLKLVVSVGLLVGGCTLQFSSVSAAHAAEASAVFQSDQLRTDFKIVRQALNEAHPDLYRYTSKEKMDHEWNRAGDSLSGPMNALEFYRVLAPLIALVRDGHMGLSLPNNVEEQLVQSPILPFGVRMVGRTPYVFRDFSGQVATRAGREIVSINGVAASKLVEAMLAVVTADGDGESARRLSLGERFAGNIVKICDLHAPYQVVLRDPKSKQTETNRLDGLVSGSLYKLWRSKWPDDIEVRMERPPSELEFIDNGAIARMRIPGWGSSEEDAKRRDLRNFFEHAFEEFAARKTRALIIDVRNNGGGEDEVAQILASHLIQKPFRYYRDIVLKGISFNFYKYVTAPDPIPTDLVARGTDGRFHFTGHPSMGLKSPREPGFGGALFLLMNGGSFSTSTEFLAAIRSHRPATFIGEESSGAYGGNNSGFEPTMTLPATKLTLRIPLAAYYMDVTGPWPARRGVMPDVTTTYSIEEMLKGVDKEFETALSLARAPKKT